MYIGNQPYQIAFVTDSFNGDGSTIAFTMSIAPANTASVLIAVSGVLQAPSTYSVSGTTLTFSGAPPSGTGNISARYLGIPASNVTTTAYRTVTNFTATSGQTTFTPPSYTAGFINVYRNGVYLPTPDYTATNGTTVVLNNGCTTGDTVTIESFLVSSVLNAIPATAGAVNSSYLASSLSLVTPSMTTPTVSSGTMTLATGLTFSDTSTQTSTGIGYSPQVWTNVTSSRALGTTYTNSTGRPILVAPNLTCGGAGVGIVYTYINGTSIGYTGQGSASSSATYMGIFTSIIVPNGATYAFSGLVGNLTLNIWWELR